MYARQPDYSRRQVKIPENYSGHAFREPSPYADMPPPARLDIPPERAEKAPEPLERSSGADIDVESEKVTVVDSGAVSIQPEPPDGQDSTKSALFSLLPSSILGGDHFPFGHGIGSEELLILAIMLLVYLSGEKNGEPDTEFLLMLGLLLFAG